jgi:hypothetical protein
VEAEFIEAPSELNLVSSRSIKISGNKIGKESTGYNVPFELAFAIIAAIIVEETAIPIFPKIRESINNPQLLIINDSNKITNKNVIDRFIKNTRRRLNINFPEKIVEGDAINCSVNVVPLSSSDTNARDKPDIAEKKITIQNNPPVRYSLIFSLPIENIITLIVTSINIANAFIAYRVLSSDCQSLRNNAMLFIL